MSRRVELPKAWTIAWGASGGAALSIDRKVMGVESTSVAFWRDRLAAFPGGERRQPLGAATIAIASFPTLDDAWTLYMLAACEAGIELPASWEAVCTYAADARHGLWVDRVRPEHAIQSVYLAIAQERLLADPPARDRFLNEAFFLFDHVTTSLEKGARLLDDDLVAGVPAFERYVRLLRDDERLYEEDRARGRRFWAEVAAVRGGDAKRKVALLALAHPAARQFKTWARADAKAPGGRGYALLLVELEAGHIVLSADPVSRVTIGALAATLDDTEAKKRDGPPPARWYDGKDHGGTIVASPEGGTALGLDEVIAALREPLALCPVAEPRPAAAKNVMRVAMGAALALIAAAGVVRGLRVASDPSAAPSAAPASSNEPARTRSESDPSGETAVAAADRRGQKGDPIPPKDVIELLDSPEGPRSMKHYALIAGVCSYTDDRVLRAPCRDARAVRDLLVRDYGYSRDDILFLIDDEPEPGERIDGAPTAEGLKLAIERFRAKFGDDENSSFLFYYSGHGGYVKGAQKDYGILQPAGFFDRYRDQPYEHRGWDMHQMIDDIKKGVPSKHLMLVLDCCYAGWAGAKGDDELDAHVASLWKERAEVVLSAGAKGQRAWEDEPEPRAWAWQGHSAMTAFLLQGLEKTASGRPAADKNEDHVVTDEELAAWVKERVPPAVRELKKAEQTPQFFRLDAHRTKSGQFLFVPAR